MENDDKRTRNLKMAAKNLPKSNIYTIKIDAYRFDRIQFFVLLSCQSEWSQ